MHPKNRSSATISIVDDDELFRDMLVEILETNGYRVIPFSSGQDFMNSDFYVEGYFDLLITDVRMPGMSGFSLCEQVRTVKDHDLLPIIMLTGGNSEREKSQGLNAGADDFIQKPFKNVDFLAKISSLLNIKNHSQQKLNRVSQFISPNIAKLVIDDNQEKKLKLHQTDVSVIFCDIRGFTAFTESANPMVVMDVLNKYYKAVGACAEKYKATLGHLAGDGIMIFLNDPVPTPDHQSVAILLALEIQKNLQLLRENWNELSFNIDFGIGVADGLATLGSIGYQQYSQYSVIGPVVNFASRLCDVAVKGQILASYSFLARLPVHTFVSFSKIGQVHLKGIQKRVDLCEILGATFSEIDFKN